MTKEFSRPTGIAVLLFRRPHYASRLLDSLAAALDRSLWRDVHFFIDGPCDFFRNYVSPTPDPAQTLEASEAIVGLVRSRFGNSANIHHSPWNLSSSLQFIGALEYLFHARNFDRTIVLEEDLELHPKFFGVMNLLLDLYEHNSRVGVVGAFGEKYESRDGPQRLSMTTMSHWLGVGWWKEKHEEHYRPVLRSFQRDSASQYRRDPVRSDCVQNSDGSPAGNSFFSYDLECQRASAAKGLVPLVPWANFASYTGNEGENDCGDYYKESGFGSMELWNKELPSRAELSRLLSLSDVSLSELVEAYRTNSSHLL